MGEIQIEKAKQTGSEIAVKILRDDVLIKTHLTIGVNMDKGLKILLNTYWGKNGWKDGSISNEDFETAKAEGYMFDYPQYVDHETTLTELKRIVSKIDKRDVVNAFLHSLSTRRLELRSSISSYIYAKSIPTHNLFGRQNRCVYCNWRAFEENPSEREVNRGYNVLNFERYKWGGVRLDNVNYVKFDLEQFLRLPKFRATDEDVNILIRILDIVMQIPSEKNAVHYLNTIKSEKILKTNSSELKVLLEILGMCDVFNSKAAKGYLHAFIAGGCNRDDTISETVYPLNYWHAYDGINSNAMFEVFDIIYR